MMYGDEVRHSLLRGRLPLSTDTISQKGCRHLLNKQMKFNNKKWAANQSILRGVKALAIELGLKSKEN
jgi:hypothetical protein